MKRSIVTATNHWDPVPRAARAAEEAGYSCVWVTEGPRRDSLVRAAGVIAATTTIQVGTGIALAFARNPLAMAGAAADLSLMSKGRFTLGLSPGARGLRRQYGVEIDKAAPWLEEYVDIVRRVTSASATGVDFQGEYFKVKLGGARLTAGPAAYQPKIYGGGLNPIMIKRVAKCCDGLALLSIGLAKTYFEETVLPAFRAGREQAGKSVKGGLSCWLIAAVADDAQTARNMAKFNLAVYFSTPSYRDSAAAMGFGDDVDALQAAFKSMGSSTDWSRLSLMIPDAMVDAFALAGTRDEVKQRLAELEQRLEQDGVDEIVLQIANVASDAEHYEELLLRTIETCAPSSEGPAAKK